MKKLFVLSLTLLLVQTASLEAKDKEADDTYVYATYFKCDATKQKDVDAIVEKEWAPVYEKAVASKVIKNWSYLKHHTGGQWRRVTVSTASSMGELLTAQDKIGEMMDAAKIDPKNVFGAACNSHDDYIWKVEGGNQTLQAAEASISVYQVCNVSKEERADEIVNKVLAPIYNANMGKGKLSSWGWLSHQVGGKYRRLFTMSAANYTDLMKTREHILETLYGDKGPAEAKELTEICTSHTDYLWDR